ncbi:hypothetical protein JOS77_21515 [Chromobacterium haemolyticum]|nr:hypothetical protein JOS77_21515 [Chromobacterium haemolyticum]
MYQPYIPLSQPFSPCLALARELVNRLWVTTGKIPAAALRFLAVLDALSASAARLAAAAAQNNPGQRPQGVEYEIA